MHQTTPTRRPSRPGATVAVVAIATLALLGGCVERAPELSPADRERLRPFVGTEAPSPQHELAAQFDHGIRLLGYDVAGDTLTPGQELEVTWYWHATQDVPDGWQLFTHIADAAGENRRNQDRVGVVRELYQPGRWRAGQYIKDTQRISVPEDWHGDRPPADTREAVVYLGLWQDEHRLRVRSGPNDGDNRVRALTLQVARTVTAVAPPAAAAGANAPAANTAIPTLRTPHTAEEITIDGALDEAMWGRAGRTRAFVNTLNGSAAPFQATARMLWDEENLYVAFDVRDDFVQNTHRGRDDHLWEQDAVGIMVDPGGEGRNYFEMQVSPTGVVFDTRYDTRRQPGPIGHDDWNSGLRAEVRVDGTANDTDADRGYVAEIAIPWGAFDAGEPPASRPEPGASWRMNLYVMDQRPSGQPGRAAGWSPTLEGDFHVPSRFATVTFAPPAPAVIAGAGGPVPSARGELLPTQAQVNPQTASAIRQFLAQQKQGVAGARVGPRIAPGAAVRQ